MQFVLQENEVCPYSLNCPYSMSCHGAKAGRPNTFSCNFANGDGTFIEGAYRNPLDKTGNMTVIMESANV